MASQKTAENNFFRRSNQKFLLHCTLSLAAQCIVIGPVCMFATGGRFWVCVFVGLLPR